MKFPKIFQLGTKYIDNIFADEVEITEKIDGSQFRFGKINGELFVASKNQELYFDNPTKMFKEGVEYIKSIEDKIPDNIIFFAEYLQKRKHNSLEYNRIPKNNLILFGVCDTNEQFDDNIEYWAKELDIESVPVIFKGNKKQETITFVEELLERESVLGKAKIEGVVVKNYHQTVLVGGQVMPIAMGKYVSEKFKEVHKKSWGKENNNKIRLSMFAESFQTEARWKKSVQRLRDEDKLEETPRDIGLLLKEINIDIIEEEEENIKEWLWKEYKGQILRTATKGFPEWYKKQLLERSE